MCMRWWGRVDWEKVGWDIGHDPWARATWMHVICMGWWNRVGWEKVGSGTGMDLWALCTWMICMRWCDWVEWEKVGWGCVGRDRVGWEMGGVLWRKVVGWDRVGWERWVACQKRFRGLQHTATYCDILRHTAALMGEIELLMKDGWRAMVWGSWVGESRWWKLSGKSKEFEGYNTRLHTATHYNTLQHTAHTATHCNTL